MRCLTHIAGNRLDLVMTNVPDIVDVVVGTPLGTSDHCFVSCVLCIEQSVPEYNAGCGRLQLGIPHWAISIITASS